MLKDWPGHLVGLVVVLGAAGCVANNSDLSIRLQDDDPAQRIRAILEISRASRSEFLPQLVDRLEDEDAAVRLYAILALERLTGTRLGYSHAAKIDKRRQAVEAWREYIAPGATAEQEAATPS